MTALTDRPRHNDVLDRGRYAQVLLWLDRCTARARKRRRAALARRLLLRATVQPGHWVAVTDLREGDVVIQSASGLIFGTREQVGYVTPAESEGVVEILTDVADHELPACDWVQLAEPARPRLAPGGIVLAPAHLQLVPPPAAPNTTGERP